MGFGRAAASTKEPVGVEGRVNYSGIRGHQGVSAVVPILATKGADGQIQLHDVVEYTVAAENLHLPVLEDIPSQAKSGSKLVSPAELNRLGRKAVCGSLAREILLFQAETRGDGNALTDGPRILQEKAVVETACISIRTIVLDVGIAVCALAI